MDSKARIAGHPIHPMLVMFPIALFTATIALQLAYLGTRDPFYFRAAMVANVGGVLMALAAVIPGAIDLLALPAPSPARTTGVRHALLNLLTTVLFGISAVLLYQGWSGREVVDGAYALDPTIPLALGVIGFLSMVIGGALGWSLVQTHHVGVQPPVLRERAASPPGPFGARASAHH